MKSNGMVVLSLDLALSTGWAVRMPPGCKSGSVGGKLGRTGERWFFGMKDFRPERGSSYGILFRVFNQWLERTLGAYVTLARGDDLELVVSYELAHYRGGAATMIGTALTSRVMEQCDASNVAYLGVRSNVLKKWAAGHGFADKAAMIQAAQGFCPSFNGKDDNIGDAICLAEYAAQNVGGQEVKK